MPMVPWEIPDVAENVSRPAALQVIRQLLQYANLPPSTPVRFAGGGGAIPVSGSTLDDVGATDQLPTDPRLSIDVTEEYEEENSGVVAVLRAETAPVFSDTDLDVYIRPVYERIKVTVEIKYNASDKTAAQSWERTVRRRVAQGITEKFHILDYHYPIPVEYLVILREIHRLRELRGGDGLSFPEWMRKHFQPSMTVIADQAGNNPLLVIRESLTGVMGYTDFNIQPPKSEKDGDAGNWSVSFRYTFHYERPENTTML